MRNTGLKPIHEEEIMILKAELKELFITMINYNENIHQYLKLKVKNISLDNKTDQTQSNPMFFPTIDFTDPEVMKLAETLKVQFKKNKIEAEIKNEFGKEIKNLANLVQLRHPCL